MRSLSTKPTEPARELRSYLSWRRSEKSNASLFRAVVEAARSPRDRALYARIAAAEDAQALADEERAYAVLLHVHAQTDAAEFAKKLILLFRRWVILFVGAALFAAAVALVRNGDRVLSSECILCQHFVAVCPPNALSLQPGLDVSRLDRLQFVDGSIERHARHTPRDEREGSA